MSIEYHLKLDGIQGESTAAKHQGEIELFSWSMGAQNSTTITGSGLSAGKVKFSDISVSKPTDKSSAKLLELCCTGKHIANGVLTCSKSTGDKNPADYLTIKLGEIHIASFQCGGSAHDEIGTESVSFAFGQIEYDYKIQGKDGTLTAAGTAKYDITKRESS
jgi:type VI secretion system secreted protein Hcp